MGAAGPFANRNGNLSGVAWATTTHAFAVGDGLTMIETFDAGATWRDVELSSSPDPLYNVKCVDANICIAIGNAATTGRDIYRTTKGGCDVATADEFPTRRFLGSSRLCLANGRIHGIERRHGEDD